MTSYEKYGLLDRIWLKVIDYSTRTYSLPRVCNEVSKMLQDLGYRTEIIGNNRDYRILKVDDQPFRIIREKGWSKYDVRMMDEQ